MILYSCQDMGFRFGADTILEHINLSINEKDRIGIIGDNGAGKTTFIKILLGEYAPTEGSLFRYGKITSDAGYLPQNAGLDSDLDVYGEFLSSYSDLIRQETAIAELEEELKHCTEQQAPALSEKLNAMYDHFVKQDGLTYKSRAESILRGLGFEKAMWSLPVGVLSGGQKTRLALGKIILRQPKLLILDEPTNHLDAESLSWLEEEIKTYPGTLLVISHDRCFLDAATDKTLLIENGSAYLYHAPYSKYTELRNHDKAYLERCYKQQQRQIAKIEAFIEKQRQWNRERNIIAAESRLKQLEKMTILEKPSDADQTPPIHFEIEMLGGKEVLDVRGLSYAYPERELFRALSFQVRRGEKVFLEGPNGCGKSTLLKILTGKLSPSAGSFRIGANIRFSYYAQDLSELDGKRTVFDEVYEHANRGRPAVSLISPGKIRSALAAFGFRGEDVFKPIESLSGGEKSRVAILKISYDRSSLLFLDEPTNHLDIKTREVLENALSVFEGTLIAVSHDRYFKQKLATRLIHIPDYCGDRLQAPTDAPDRRAGDAYRKQKEERARLRKMEARKEQLEKECEEICKKLDNIERELADPSNASDYEGLERIYDEKLSLERKMEDILTELDAFQLT